MKKYLPEVTTTPYENGWGLGIAYATDEGARVFELALFGRCVSFWWIP